MSDPTPIPRDPAEAVAPDADGAMIFQCQRCGHDLPPMSAELAKMAMSTGGITLAHDVCPTDAPPEPEGRYFELRAQIVEVSEPRSHFDDGAGGLGEPTPDVTEMMSFRVGHRATNLDEAMRPLAGLFGEKWTAAEKQARIADADAMPVGRPAPLTPGLQPSGLHLPRTVRG